METVTSETSKFLSESQRSSSNLGGVLCVRMVSCTNDWSVGVKVP